MIAPASQPVPQPSPGSPSQARALSTTAASPQIAAWPPSGTPPLRKNFRRGNRLALQVLTSVNVSGVILLFILLCVISERWWFSGALSYLPRLPFALPSLILAVLTVRSLPRWSAANLVAASVVLVFIAGLSAPVDRDPWPADRSRVLTVVTCNVQEGRSFPEKLVHEFHQLDPDLLVLQESLRCDEFLASLAGASIVQRGEYCLVSRYPARVVDELRTSSLIDEDGRLTAVLFEVDHPDETLYVLNVHCHTVRWGLSELRWHSPLTGVGVDAFRTYQIKRELEMADLRAFAASAAARGPLLILGDFNTPSTSSLYLDVWSGSRNAFEAAGWGYGYTSPCNTSGRWPPNTPWIRIDHILTSDDWLIHAAGIGESDGSDHRLVWSQVSLRIPLAVPSRRAQLARRGNIE